jgi:hypothetical protein
LGKGDGQEQRDKQHQKPHGWPLESRENTVQDDVLKKNCVQNGVFEILNSIARLSNPENTPLSLREKVARSAG